MTEWIFGDIIGGLSDTELWVAQMVQEEVIGLVLDRDSDGKEIRRPGRKPTADITEHQGRTLKAIRKFILDRGIPPTVADIASMLGLRSSTIHDQINQLIQKGFLTREDGKARGLSVVREPTSVLTSLVSIPIVGKVAAGLPILAEENVVGEVLVESSVTRSGRYFALEVQGVSMIDAGINPGDLLIVRQQPIAENGDIVVALIDNEATVKRLVISGEDIMLKPENPSCDPIPIDSDADLRITGKVVAVRSLAASKEDTI